MSVSANLTLGKLVFRAPTPKQRSRRSQRTAAVAGIVQQVALTGEGQTRRQLVVDCLLSPVQRSFDEGLQKKRVRGVEKREVFRWK